MWNSVKKLSLYVFIGAVIILAVIALASIWGVFDDDVIGKSLGSLALIGGSALLISIMARIRQYVPGSSTHSGWRIFAYIVGGIVLLWLTGMFMSFIFFGF